MVKDSIFNTILLHIRHAISIGLRSRSCKRAQCEGEENGGKGEHSAEEQNEDRGQKGTRGQGRFCYGRHNSKNEEEERGEIDKSQAKSVRGGVVARYKDGARATHLPGSLYRTGFSTCGTQARVGIEPEPRSARNMLV